MATDIARSVTDELHDAGVAAAAVDRELGNVRAHLARAQADPTPGNTAGARRAAAVLAGVAATLAAYASEAHFRAAQSSAVS